MWTNKSDDKPWDGIVFSAFYFLTQGALTLEDVANFNI